MELVRREKNIALLSFVFKLSAIICHAGTSQTRYIIVVLGNFARRTR